MDTAITAEALAVTFLSEIIRRAPGTTVEPFAEVLKAANASEVLHLGGGLVQARAELLQA